MDDNPTDTMHQYAEIGRNRTGFGYLPQSPIDNAHILLSQRSANLSRIK